jgi:hypothetical protein
MMTKNSVHVLPTVVAPKLVQHKPASLWPYLEIGSTAVLLGILLFASTLTNL